MRPGKRYETLVKRHRNIEQKLTTELKRPMPDSSMLQRLKRQKLLIRDEIQSWELLMRAVRVEPPRQMADA